MEPARSLDLVLASTTKATKPGPEVLRIPSLLTSVTVIQVVLLAAAQLQPSGAVTVILHGPPASASTSVAVGEIEYVQIFEGRGVPVASHSSINAPAGSSATLFFAVMHSLRY